MKRILPLTALVCALAAPTLAFSSTAVVDISPTRLDLDGKSSGVFRLRNQGSDEVRFEIFAFLWELDEGGEMQLSPTDEIAFFPSIFSIAPGATRKIRVGAGGPAGERERSYRLLIKQLSEQEGGANGTTIRVLTDFSVPVFVTHPSHRARPQFEVETIADGRLAFRLANRGSRSLQAASVEAEFADEAGETLQRVELPAWYVLAGTHRAFEVELSPKTCPRAKQLHLRARLAGDETHQERIDAPCAQD